MINHGMVQLNEEQPNKTNKSLENDSFGKATKVFFAGADLSGLKKLAKRMLT